MGKSAVACLEQCRWMGLGLLAHASLGIVPKEGAVGAVGACQGSWGICICMWA